MLLPLIFGISSTPSDWTFTTDPQSMSIVWRDQQIKLTPLTSASVNVTVTTAGVAPSPSFVRVPTRAPKFSVRRVGDDLWLKTSALQVVFSGQTGSLRYLTGQGKPLLSEMPGSRRLSPRSLGGVPLLQVAQSFDSPSSERLYGLGQFQEGVWNWRGLPVELRQLNTQIAVPMVVSSRGYGLLWENASRTDFNPPETEIPLSRSGDAGSGGPTATEQLGNRARPSESGTATGTFTATVGGDYGFCVRDGNRRDRLILRVKGQTLAEIRNMWTPSALVGRIHLDAGERVPVEVVGGGGGVKAFVRRLDDSTTFRSDYGDRLDYTVFAGPRAADIVAGYRQVTGAAPMWPKWAYGFWQCRERYSSQPQILDTVAEFRRRRIPIDLIVQDWQYWGNHGWGAYEWDERSYPDPKGMIAKLHEQDVRFMISAWCNPSGIAGEALRKEGAALGNWVDVFGTTGRNVRWDYINRAFFSNGTDAWWGDATEPGDPGTEILGKTTARGPGDLVTSAYPLFASQGLYEGQRKTDDQKRVCILTRSAFPGAQRYGAAAWSGDVMGDWVTFRRQIPAGLNFSLTGIPYWTTDAAGFFRPGGQYQSADYNELLVRWLQWSTFCPIFRAHGYQTSTEIWNYLPETQRIFLKFDELRYRMLPYNYSVAWDVSSNGQSFLRPLATEFPDDLAVAETSDAYMFGPSLLVAPVTSAGATRRTVVLPATRGGWFDFWSQGHIDGGKPVDVEAPLDQIPLLVRAGSILPLDPVRQHANERVTGPTELRVYAGADGKFTLYDDAGDGYGYEKGERATVELSWNDRTSTLRLSKRAGRYPGMPATRAFRVKLILPNGKEAPAQTLQYTGEAMSCQVKVLS